MQNSVIEELNVRELDEVNGGNPLLIVAAVAVGVYLGANFVAGVIDGASGNKSQTS